MADDLLDRMPARVPRPRPSFNFLSLSLFHLKGPRASGFAPGEPDPDPKCGGGAPEVAKSLRLPPRVPVIEIVPHPT